MNIRDGKFYEGDKIVPMEHGNMEQIKIMNGLLKRYEDFKKGLILDVSYQKEIIAIVRISCVCGCSFYKETEVDEEDDIEQLEGVVTCKKCNQRYNITQNDDGKLIVKFHKMP